MDNQNIQQLRIVIDILDRNKKTIVACILACLSIGLAFYLSQPKLYESTALLSYQQQEVTPAKMSPGTQAKISDIVSTTTQIVTSRTSLEKIINDEKLYRDLLQNLPMEDVVGIMRTNISIIPSKKGDTFQIAYTGNTAAQVVRVANALSARFIEENLKYREEKASETSVYTQEELDMTKEMLDKKEGGMRDYKLKHYNEMPDQRATNINRMIALQDQYQQKQDSIQDLQRTRVLVREQIVAQEQLVESGQKAAQNGSAKNVPVIESPLQKLNRSKAELSALKQRYTEQHPKIKRLERQVADLEREVGGKTDESAVSDGQTTAFNQTLFDLRLQLKGLELNIEKLTKEKEGIQGLIEQCDAWIAAAPVREAEWTALTREYDQLKARYDFLVGQNLQAKSMLNLERKQKGSQFKVEDSARKPTRPVKPKFMKIMLMATLAGFGLGAAIAICLQMVDSSFRNTESLESVLGVDVLCVVPRFSLEKERRKRKFFSWVVYLFLLIWLIALILGMLYLWQQGKIII